MIGEHRQTTSTLAARHQWLEQTSCNESIIINRVWHINVESVQYLQTQYASRIGQILSIMMNAQASHGNMIPFPQFHTPYCTQKARFRVSPIANAFEANLFAGVL